MSKIQMLESWFYIYDKIRFDGYNYSKIGVGFDSKGNLVNEFMTLNNVGFFQIEHFN